MISPQSSLDAVSGSHVQEDELTTTMDMKTLSQSLGGLGSEGSSGMSSGPVFRDSTSSKRLGSAESSSSDSSSSAPVFADDNSNKEQISFCNSCTIKDSRAVAKCFDCSSFLCASCVMAHQFVPRFEGHYVVILGEVANRFTGRDENEDLDVLTRVILEGKIKAKEISEDKNLEATSFRLSSQYMKAVDEVNETYQFYIAMLQGRKTELLKELEQSFRSKQVALSVYGRKALETSNKIHQVTDFGDRLMKHASTSEILLFKKPIETRLHQLLAYMPVLNTTELTELEFISNFQAKQEVGGFRQQPPIGRLAGSPTEESQSANSPRSLLPMDLTGGHRDQDPQTISNSISPIKKMYEDASFIADTHSTPANVITDERKVSFTKLPNPLDKNISTSLTHFSSTPIKPAASSLLAPLLNSSNELSSLLKGSYMEDRSASPYDKWANSSDNLFSGLAVGSNNQVAASYGSSLLAPSSDHVASLPYLGLSSNFPRNFSALGSHSLANTSPEFNFRSNFNALESQPLANISPSDYISPTDLTSLVYPTPAKSHIKRQKMIYHCKFGEFGILEDQFTEPSGVAVNAQNDIIVADTNNHKIKIFDKEGRFKFQFGEVGKRDGQLLYPNRVAVFKDTGDIVVTERSPTHQVQIYTKHGQFIRKFGATILQHPRGVCVDNMGRVIVVECKVMRVVIFDDNGNLLKKFGCSQYLHFPNGVVVNDRQEILISDNRAHCVKVFDYHGNYLRQIGDEGVTNYPIGVGINAKGEVTIADNHNNFNLTVFSQEGLLISAFESKVKHAQCYDVSLMDDGSVVLASKDFKLYVYKYVQASPNATELHM